MNKKNNISFVEIFDTITEKIQIRDKSFREWEAYLTISIYDTEEVDTLRWKLREASDKLDEALNIYSELKLAYNNVEMNEEAQIKLSLTELLNNKEAKTGADAERKAKAEHYSITIQKRIGEMLLESWAHQVDKLKHKIKVLEIHIYSYNAEMKNLYIKRGSND